MGVAFLLRVIGISEEFMNLNWFDSMEIKLNRDLETAKIKHEKSEKQKAMK